MLASIKQGLNHKNIKAKSISPSYKSFLAFTLAEILITLGIIAVVAAITMPTIIGNYQKTVYTSQLKKTYVEMMTMLQNHLRENGGDDLVQSGFCSGGNNASAKEFLANTFKIAKDCGLDSTECFAPVTEYRSWKNKSTKRTTNINGYKVILASGAAVSLYCYNMSEESIIADIAEGNYRDYRDEPIASLYIDVNGKKGPNIGGRDLFRVYIYPDLAIDGYDMYYGCRHGESGCSYGNNISENHEVNFASWCHNPNDTDGCFDKILNDGWKMNY